MAPWAIHRRTLLAAVAAGVASAARGQPSGALSGERRYDRAIVIDGLGDLDDPGVALEAPFSPRLRDDLRQSGLTAISLTLGLGASGDRFANVIRKIAAYDEKIAAAPDLLMRIRTAKDLQTAKNTRRVGLIYNVQDSALLDGDLNRVGLLAGLGLRVMQLTYNPRNIVGDGCLEPGDAGLSVFGRQLVAELASSRVVMDLSHGGRRTIREAIGLAKAPAVISHTGCRALVDFPRNVDDAALRALAEKGGVAGIYFMPFLSPAGQVGREDLIRHVEHAFGVCGEDHVGLGTDGGISRVELDPGFQAAHRRYYETRVAQGFAAPGEGAERFNLIADYNEPRRLLLVADDLARRGWPERRIDKLLGANFQRVFTEVWG